MYALVGELIEAHGLLSRAVTEYLVWAIGPPAGGAGTLRAILLRDHRRDGLLRAYGRGRGLRINYGIIDDVRRVRNLLAHDIDRVDAGGVRVRNADGPYVSEAELRAHVEAARRATRDLEAGRR